MYKLDKKKKIITVFAGTTTDEERNEIRDYKDFENYTIKVVDPKTRRGDPLKEKEILEVIGEDKEALKTYQEIKKTMGFFKAKYWYKKEYLQKKAKEE